MHTLRYVTYIFSSNQKSSLSNLRLRNKKLWGNELCHLKMSKTINSNANVTSSCPTELALDGVACRVARRAREIWAWAAVGAAARAARAPRGSRERSGSGARGTSRGRCALRTGRSWARTWPTGEAGWCRRGRARARSGSAAGTGRAASRTRPACSPRVSSSASSACPCATRAWTAAARAAAGPRRRRCPRDGRQIPSFPCAALHYSIDAKNRYMHSKDPEVLRISAEAARVAPSESSSPSAALRSESASESACLLVYGIVVPFLSADSIDFLKD